MKGGKGGPGGSGGHGGPGGSGGRGGGGAGGTISIAATRIHFRNSLNILEGIDVAGGAGGIGPAPAGNVRLRSDAPGIYTPFAPTTSRANPYHSYLSTIPSDEHPENTPLVHGNYRLIGGPDAYGLLGGFWSTNLGLTVRTNYGTSWQSSPPAPANAVGLVQRVNFRSLDTPLDQLLFINTRNSDLRQPKVAANRATDDTQATPIPLQVRGPFREAPFVANPAGPETLDTLPPYHAWLTYLRPGNSTITTVFTPYTTPVTSIFQSSGTGSGDQNFWLLDTGLLSVDTAPAGSLGGVTQVSDRQTNSLSVTAYARRGPGTPLPFNVRNTGRAGSLMSSLPGSSLVFSNLAPNAVATLSLTLGRTNQPNPTFASIVTDAGTIHIAAQATVVGPVIETALTETNATQIVPGQTRELIFTAQNTFLPALGTPAAVYQANILGASIVGPDAAFFSLQGPTQGVIPLKHGPFGLSEISWTNRILFTPAESRDYVATLEVVTDDEAPPGTPGRVYTFSLSRSVVTPVITITQQPADTTGEPGGTAAFGMAATVSPTTLPLTYQWKRNQLAIPGATDPNYVTEPLEEGAYYTCEVRAGTVSVESDMAWVSLVSTNGAYPQAVLADQPLLYYRLDEIDGVTAFDFSGNGNHGRRSNILASPSYSPPLGLAAEFRGAAWGGSIAVPALVDPETGSQSFSNLTVEAWVRLKAWNDSLGAEDYGLSGLLCGNGFPTGSFQLVAGNPNQFIFTVRDSSSGNLANDYAVADDVVFTTGSWLHLAAVYSATEKTFRFYTNGAQATLVNLDAAPPVFFTNSHLGAWLGLDGNLHRFLDGQLDEVAVYAKALSPERIKSHYEAPAAVLIAVPPQTVAVAPGETATFSVSAEAVGTRSPLTFQWRRGDALIPGATNAVYTTGPLGPSDNGAAFTCTLTAGTATQATTPAYVIIAPTNTPYAQAVLEDAPLFYYRLEEQGVPIAFDSSGNGFHGTYSNAVAAPGPAPWLGSSAAFGGAAGRSSIAVPALFDPLFLGSYFQSCTFEAWVRLNAWNNLSGDPNDHGLSGLLCGEQWPNGSFQFVAGSENYLSMGVRDSSGAGFYNDYATFNPDLFTTNEWMHLATVYDSSTKTFRLYVNGAQAAAFDLDEAPPVFLGASRLGAWLGFDGALHRFLDGQLDEVAGYGHALSPDRIAAHYNVAVSIRILSQPKDAWTQPGGVAAFSVTAAAPGTDLPLRFQWSRNDVPIPGETNATLVTPTVGLPDHGAGYRCRVSVGPFSRESATAHLTVLDAPSLHGLTVLADQPLLYYRFEEAGGQTVFDSSGFSRHGTASNAFHEPGPVSALGSAVSFHGNTKSGHVRVPALQNPSTGTELFSQFTLATWVRIQEWNTVDLLGESTLFGTDLAAPGSFQLSIRQAGQIALTLSNPGAGGIPEVYAVSNGLAFQTNAWLHLAVVYDAPGATLKLYTNGVWCETFTLNTAPPAILGPGRLGSWDAGISVDVRSLDGQLDELAIFGTALSADKIAALHQSAAVIRIAEQPADTAASPGGTATFTVVAEVLGAQAPLHYQWQRDGINVPGATNATHTTPALDMADHAARFHCVVSTGLAAVESDPAFVTLIDTNAPYVHTLLASQPLVYYRFEEQAGRLALDSSGHGYHGVYSNVARTNAAAPWFGSSARFAGPVTRSSVAVPALINPATSDSFFDQVTVAAWVKLDAWNEVFAAPEYGLSAIYSGNYWPEGSFQLSAANASGIRFGVRDSAGGGYANDYPSANHGAFDTNSWFHLAVVYDSINRTFRLHLNGVLTQEIPLDLAPRANLSGAHLGAWLGFDENLARFLQGQLDEFAVFGTALSPATIAAHYQAAVALRITQQPADIQAPDGGPATFTVAATAPGAGVPLQYQWLRNDAPVPGATNASYVIPSAGFADAGGFHCTVSAGPFTVQSARAYLTISSTNSAYARAVLADQPLLYYRMEEIGGRTAFDSSGHGFHGVRTNVESQSGFWPEVGTAAGFGGAATRSRIEVPALIHPVTGNSSFHELTVEAWVRLNAWNEDPADLGLSGIFTGDAWPPGSFQLTVASPHRFQFGVRDSQGAVLANDYGVTDPVVFTTNAWLHLVAVYDSAALTFRFYTNGAEAAVIPLEVAPPALLTGSHLGAWMGLDGNLARFFDGQIDEVAVYATALSPARIIAHYRAAFPLGLSLTPLDSGVLRLDWVGPGAVLQKSTNPSSPDGWFDSPGALQSPVIITPGEQPEFFRLRR